MARGYEPRLNRVASRWALIGVPAISVMFGSMTVLIPQVSVLPLLPPFGLLILLAWRMIVRDLWPVWAALPLGFFDDIFSGQPLGSAMLLWTLVFLVLDIFDRWMMWRDYRQDWAIAGTLVAVVQLVGLAIANGSGGFVINGEFADDNSGVSVASAGDVNGDGDTNAGDIAALRDLAEFHGLD